MNRIDDDLIDESIRIMNSVRPEQEINVISLRKVHNKLRKNVAKLLKSPVDSYNKQQLEELFQTIENIGFIKGLAMAAFDNPSNILKKIKELENG